MMSANYEKDEVKFFDVPPIEKWGEEGCLWLLPLNLGQPVTASTNRVW